MSRRARTSGGSGTRPGKQSGQALLELALVVPVILLLLLSLVQFAVIFERQIGITNAIREAARRTAALTTKDDATAQTNATWALGEAVALLGNSQTHESSRDNLEVCIVTPASPDDVDVAGHTQVVVRIKDVYKHPLFLPIITQILDGIDGSQDDSLLASATVEFHVEQQDYTTEANLPGGGGAARSNGTTTPCTP